MIKVHSTFGTIWVNSQGKPVSDLPPDYNNIAKFDLNRLEKMCISNHIPMRDEWDILALGYWTKDGNYEHPADDYSENGIMRHIWSGRVNDLDEALEYECE